MLFEAKFEVAYRLVFGIKIEVEDEQDDDKDCARNSKGTYLNLVIIDEL
jgi:hypothetical protein